MGWGNTCNVDTSVNASSTILFRRNGATTIRQLETVETMEVRGHNATGGKTAGKQHEDNTVETTYYGFIDGEVFSFDAKTGTRVEWGAARKDESGQWVATKRTIIYSVEPTPDSTIWGTKPLNEEGQPITLSANGVPRVVSYDKSSSFACRFASMSLTTTVATTVTEYRYIDTQAHAQAIVNANSSTHSSFTNLSTYVAPPDSHTLPGPYATMAVPSGSEKFASARYVSPRDGWTVTVNEKTFGWSGNGWHT